MMKNTKDHILSTAERLIAEKGYHSTSVRDITGEAGVNVSAISYHFGSKEKLFEAVITKRLDPINEQRMAKLEEIIQVSERENILPDVRSIINAFLEPVWEMLTRDEDGKHFLMILGSIFQDSDTHLRNKFIDIMAPVAVAFFQQICRAVPDLDQGEIFLRLQLSLGAFHQGFRIMFHPNHRDDIQKLHHFALPDNEEYYNQIINYVARGILP